ncbi:MAG TPA: flagellar protein FlgN [Azospira sp.]|nr:flagellar protein FlgN [Azospira sp.]
MASLPPPVLLSLLQSEVQAMGEFVTILKREQELLTRGETDPLPELAESKGPLVARLNGLDNQRSQLLNAAGLGADSAGMEAWLRQHPQEFACQAAWARLKDVVTEARELNQLNGKLINLRMQHNNQALSALISASGQNNTLYGPDGQPAQLSGRRIIDAA